MLQNTVPSFTISPIKTALNNLATLWFCKICIVKCGKKYGKLQNCIKDIV